MRPLLVAIGLAASGCAHVSTGFRCPAQGGVAWREVRTRHFVVQTDLSSGRAQELARELEMLDTVVRGGLFRNPPQLPGVVHVVAFRSVEELDLFAPAGAAAFYTLSRWSEPTIVMGGELDWAQRAVIAHELVHDATSRAFLRQPRWFQEGLATFMETAGSSGPDRTPTVGGVPEHRFRSVFPYHGGIGAVLTAKGSLDERQYGLAWALVHYLLNRQAAGFGELQARFGRGEDPEVAWRAVFPQWDPAVPGAADALDREIGGYLAGGRYAYRDVHLSKDHAVTERPFSASEVHGVRLGLTWHNRGKPYSQSALEAEIDEALAEDPGNVPALSRRMQLATNPADVTGHPARPRLGAEERAALARRAVDAHPDDVRAWLLLSSYPAPPYTREGALRRAIDADPGNVFALGDLAWELLQQGRSGEALPLARSAAALAPWSAAIQDTLAGVLEDLGQCTPALAAQRRAVDLLPERASAEARQPYLARAERLEQRCGAKAIPAARR